MARILVIDDDASLLQMMSLMLKRAGHHPILAHDGHEGIAIARNQQPDLAIVDVMMPDINGYEVCETLRQDPQTAGIPLLVLTALSQPEQHATAIESGADDFITKPVTRDDLVKHVTELLESGPRSVPVSSQPPPASEPPAPTPPRQRPPSRQATPPATGASLIAVVGLHIGVGATTVAINLGTALVEDGRTCLADLHTTRGQLAAHLKMTPPRTTWESLRSVQPGEDKRNIGSALLMNQALGLAVLAAPEQAANTELSADTLAYVFEVLSEGFRSIILDLPPDPTDMSIEALHLATHIIAVIGDDPLHLNTVPGAVRDLEDMGLSAELHLVVNHTRPHGISADDVQQAVNYPLSANIPYQPEQVAAVMNGTPLVVSQPETLFARTIQQLARQLR